MSHPLRRYREVHGLTQVELGRRLGKTKATISRWERGRRLPRKRDLRDICAMTGISVGELLEFELCEAAE